MRWGGVSPLGWVVLLVMMLPVIAGPLYLLWTLLHEPPQYAIVFFGVTIIAILIERDQRDQRDKR